MNENKRAVIIGRHSGIIPGIDVVAQKAVLFPATADECIPVIKQLLAEAGEDNLLFQNTPGQVTAALLRLVDPVLAGVGVVISKPGPRPDAIRITATDELVAVVALLNPNAKIVEGEDGARLIEFTPPMKFEFSHIEWFG